jgi:hypothetical protein
MIKLLTAAQNAIPPSQVLLGLKSSADSMHNETNRRGYSSSFLLSHTALVSAKCTANPVDIAAKRIFCTGILSKCRLSTDSILLRSLAATVNRINAVCKPESQPECLPGQVCNGSDSKFSGSLPSAVNDPDPS